MSGSPGDRPENGGFPEPPPSARERVVAVQHPGCGARTRVRLPGAVPAIAVRRLRCAGCAGTFEASTVEDLGVEAPGDPARGERSQTTPRPAAAPRAVETTPTMVETPPRAVETTPRARAAAPAPVSSRQRRAWRWAGPAIGAAAVVGALLLIQGGESIPTSPAPPGGTRGAPAAPAAEAPAGSEVPSGARLVRGSSYALALPAAWKRDRSPPDGASFAAVASDGGADATLWVERAPELDLASFEQRSLDQLRSLAGSARVVERVAAPSPEATIVRLAATAPPGEPALEVTLRAAGPFRYYLATTVEPGASRTAVDGAELIHGSFTPEAGGRG